jgi:hypothetical protein
MELTFKTKNRRQLEASQYWNDTTTEQILYGGAKAGGKSYLGASLIFADALTYPETHYFIARKELTDLRKFTIPTIHEVFANWGLKIDDYATFNGQDNTYTLYNKSKVYLIACKEEPSDPLFERLGSMQMTRGWIEEAGEVAEAAKDNLWLAVGRWKNDVYNLPKKLLITANPKKGWMKRDFIEPYQTNSLPPHRKFVPALVTDNKYMSQSYIDTLSAIKDQASRERLFLGNWDYDEDKNALVTYDALSDAFSNTPTKDNQKYLIVDVARFGKDATTLSFWRSMELYKIEKFHLQDTQNTIQKIKDYAATEQIPFSNILIDEDGIGGAVVDGLKGTRGFIANSRPLPTSSEIRGRLSKIESHLIPKTNYQNLKAQCAFKLAELITEHKIAFKVPEYREVIMEELTALLKQRNKDDDGKLQIIPKDEVKASIGHSPDIGDPIIYRAWFELNKEATLDSPQRHVMEEKQKQRLLINKTKIAGDSTR